MAPLRGILIYTVYGSAIVTKLWATLHTHWRDSVCYYTVTDHQGSICVITGSYRVAQRYLVLCAEGLTSAQILQLDHYMAKAPLRNKQK